MPDILSALDSLTKQAWYSGQAVDRAQLAPRSPAYAQPAEPLPEPLQRYLAECGVVELYRHQAELLDLARAGRNVIITTGTASGKTLAFNLPVAEALLADRRATALYLYPMKAVTQDQLRVLRVLDQAAGLDLAAAVYDGDTPSDKRPGIRRKARVILSNPYELHQVLPYHHQWARFYRNLRYCVVDEAHQYRGVFGSNVAQVMRRLRRILRLHGADPQFILSSASIANPVELARRLTGKEFVHVSEDGSPRGRSWLVFWDALRSGDTIPNSRANSGHVPSVSPHTQTQALVSYFARAGFQTVCFVQSRRMAELISMWVKEQSPALDVSPYRAGYVPEDRRRIESGLSSGGLKAVVSTSALELGVDIGGLDCIIIAGYPGSLASFWQQAGRAGRKLQDSCIVFVGFSGGLDQFLLHNPQVILDRSFESAVIDLGNPYILKGHLACAASESPIRNEEVAWGTAEIAGKGQSPALGAPQSGTVPAISAQYPCDLVKELESELVLRKTPAGYIYSGRERPQEVVTLDAIEQRAIEVVVEGRVIETLDRARAYREAHPGAVLLHQGETYVVQKLDLENRRAEAEKKSVDYYTGVIEHEEVRLVEELESRPFGAGCALGLSRIQVTERITGYRMKRYDRLLATHPLDLPPVEFKTIGVWLQLEANLPDELARQGFDFMGSIHGAEHALISLAPLLAMCDPRDLGGASYRLFPEKQLPAILIYDGFENGIGISEKLFAEFDRLVGMTCDLVGRCACDEGCPACVLSPRCGDGNQPMSKPGARAVLERLAAARRSGL